MEARTDSLDAYLASLPEERRQAIEAVREVVNDHLPSGYAEGMQFGMIGWFVPHEVYPAGYHTNPNEPLPLAALASQKHHMSLHLMGLYVPSGEPGMDETEHARWFREAWATTGKKLDMGKSCVRFKRLDDLPLDVIGQAIARVPVAAYIESYERIRPPARRPPAR